MSTISGRILVFAGAGASKAVHSENFPTTREFFDDLLSPITSDPLFGVAIKYLRSQFESETIDIEQVLWALQIQLDFFKSVHAKGSAVSFLFQSNVINSMFPHQNIGSFSNISQSMINNLSNLISKINEIVYDLYGYEPEKREIAGNWLPLIEALDGVGTKLDIFTTNYDVVIESALNEINGEATSRDWRGIKGRARQTVDLGRWADAENSGTNGILTKLHGSLDWKFSGDSIYVGDPVFTGDHTKQAIIYPGFKGESSAPFFQIFHEYLARSISDSKVLIFIGFAFRDEHINRLIRENVRRDSRVIIINPDKSVRFPSRLTQPKYITSGFDISAIKQINVLFSEIQQAQTGE